MWLNGKQLAGASISEATVCEKARKLDSYLLQKTKNLSTSATSNKLKTSHEWFDKFQKRCGIHSVIRHSEDSSSDKASAETYKQESMQFIKAEGYVA